MNRRISKAILVLALLALGVSGCALMPKTAKGPVFSLATVPKGKAMVYFFRPERFAMSGTTIFMSIPTEADNCFALVNNGYYPHIADPGTLNVSAAALGGGNNLSMELKPGQKRFVQTAFGAWGPKPEFTELSEEAAMSLISQNRLIGKCK